MNRVFRIHHDTSKFDSLSFSDRPEFDRRNSQGVPVFTGLESQCHKWCPPLECIWNAAEKQKPTFPYIAEGAIAMSRQTFDICYEVFN